MMRIAQMMTNIAVASVGPWLKLWAIILFTNPKLRLSVLTFVSTDKLIGPGIIAPGSFICSREI